MPTTGEWIVEDICGFICVVSGSVVIATCHVEELHDGDRPIEVKWESTMHTDKNSHVSVAKPVSASVDREDIKLPSAFPGKIAEAASGT